MPPAALISWTAVRTPAWAPPPLNAFAPVMSCTDAIATSPPPSLPPLLPELPPELPPQAASSSIAGTVVASRAAFLCLVDRTSGFILLLLECVVPGRRVVRAGTSERVVRLWPCVGQGVRRRAR